MQQQEIGTMPPAILWLGYIVPGALAAGVVGTFVCVQANIVSRAHAMDVRHFSWIALMAICFGLAVGDADPVDEHRHWTGRRVPVLVFIVAVVLITWATPRILGVV